MKSISGDVVWYKHIIVNMFIFKRHIFVVISRVVACGMQFPNFLAVQHCANERLNCNCVSSFTFTTCRLTAVGGESVFYSKVNVLPLNLYMSEFYKAIVTVLDWN